jgi:hypothetical protein
MTVERSRPEAPLDVFSNGVLIHLNVRCWGALSKLDDKHLGELPKNIVRAVYDLLKDKTYLTIVHNIRSEAVGFVGNNSLPFPIAGLHFIPKKLISHVNTRLQRYQNRFWVAIEEFLDNYSSLIADYAKEYPKLYEPQKYPSVVVLRTRFCFEWTFRHFNVPDVSIGVLPPEVYGEELRKFQSEMREMRDMAVSVVGKQFIEKIESLKDQCLDSSGNINTATVNAVHNFLDRFDRLWDGFVAHPQLKRMIGECKEYMAGTDADMLRADETFRGLIGKKMGEITDHLDSLADARLYRRLDI